MPRRRIWWRGSPILRCGLWMAWCRSLPPRGQAGPAVAGAADHGVGLRLIDQAGVAAGTVLSAPAQITVLSGAGPDRLIWTGASSSAVICWAAPGIGAAETGALPPGPISAQTFTTLGDAAFAILAPLGENRLLVCRMTATGQMVAVDGTDLGNPVQQAVDITALAALRIGAAHYVLSLSAAEESLRVWALGPNGTLTAVSQVGAGAGLGLSTPRPWRSWSLPGGPTR
ncbi:hypothetical protein ACFSHQ_21070 [Gemmobacter lanyuensis]